MQCPDTGKAGVGFSNQLLTLSMTDLLSGCKNSGERRDANYGRQAHQFPGREWGAPLFGLWLPIMAASRGVIFYANVVKSAESKTWGLLEVRFIATLVSAGSIQFLLFLSYSWLSLCPNYMI